MTIVRTPHSPSLLAQALVFLSPGLLLLAAAAGLFVLWLILGLTVAASSLPFASMSDAQRSLAVARDMALYTALAGVAAAILGLLSYALAALVGRMFAQRDRPAARPPQATQPAEQPREHEVGGRR
ncbi:MAG: hypothetical protein RLZZ387_5027 [Chloroflexota bacterium]|jgi:hypothetical protein